MATMMIAAANDKTVCGLLRAHSPGNDMKRLIAGTLKKSMLVSVVRDVATAAAP
jgi:hypothetical protein